jgi:hypothetical protein
MFRGSVGWNASAIAGARHIFTGVTSTTCEKFFSLDLLQGYPWGLISDS